MKNPTGRASRGPFRVAFVPLNRDDGQGTAEVGYAVGRRCGNAVVRNHLRRRLREAVRQECPDLSPGAYLVSAAPSATTLAYRQLATAVCEAMQDAARRGGAQAGPTAADRSDG